MLKNQREIELRHILLTPSVSEAQTAAKEKISLIRNKIIDKKITFAEAGTESDQETRANGGSLINQNTRYSF
jgi:peptidyl-prolyl cis-trans isomerase SurA